MSSASSRVALVGDYSDAVLAHRAIPKALALANEASAARIEWTWIHSTELGRPETNLDQYAGFWVVPASPYANFEGILEVIRFAREGRRPFLGTCGGFQHALIEFARNVLGIADADHAESNPTGQQLVVRPLACSLVDQLDDVRFVRGSRLQAIYGAPNSREGYRCRYGVNAAYREAFEASGLDFSAHDSAGDIRALELPRTIHPFFMATLFQPERAALEGVTPPLVLAFCEQVALVASR